jgi:spoIIIJ-associated protein
MGIGSKPAVILAWLKEEPKKSIEEVVTEFLTKVCGAMNLTVKVNITVEDKDMNIDIVGDDMGVLIGKRGQTLDSLQYLVSLVVNKEAEEFYRVKLDTENYRARRKETLENLARNIAFKVKKTRRPVSLEPMNPYERRIIHAALQGDKYVVTSSRGEDPNRYVVISFKKNNFYKDNQQ